MTAEYENGFRKMAEALGADPDALLKKAFGIDTVARYGGRVIGGAKRLAGRFGELLAGGSAKVMKPYRYATVIDMVNKGMASRQGGNGIPRVILDMLRSRIGMDMKGLAGRFSATAVTPANREMARAAESELRKVYGARALAGAGVYGASKAVHDSV